MPSKNGAGPASAETDSEARKFVGIGTRDADPFKPQARLSIDQVRVGERHRKDMGDIAALAANIAEVGLLHPIVVTPDGTLIAGERRLRAAELLGWTEIPITVVDLEKIVLGEYAENAFRKQLTPTEAADIADAIEPIEEAAAKERQREAGKERGRGQIASGKFPEAIKGRALDKVGKALGRDRKTIEKARAVRDAAKAEPEKFGKLQADMDRTGRVNTPFKRLRVMQQAARIRAEPPPLPGNGPYRAAMVDAPWAYEPDADDTSQRAALPYLTMSIEQLCALDVASVMHQDAVIGFWVTNFILVQGLHIPVLRAWGFEPKTLVTWPKDHPGRGHWLKGQTEHFVIATRGNPIVTLTDQTTLLRGAWHLVRKSAHSSKPVEAYTFFESLCPAPRYADLFSHYQHNDKWDCHGDQAPRPTVVKPAALDASDPPKQTRRKTQRRTYTRTPKALKHNIRMEKLGDDYARIENTSLRKPLQISALIELKRARPEQAEALIKRAEAGEGEEAVNAVAEIAAIKQARARSHPSKSSSTGSTPPRPAVVDASNDPGPFPPDLLHYRKRSDHG
jgi:N6-adenosine-specific RNA methylase IME4